jgi:hypothetical protein
MHCFNTSQIKKAGQTRYTKKYLQIYQAAEREGTLNLNPTP